MTTPSAASLTITQRVRSLLATLLVVFSLLLPVPGAAPVEAGKRPHAVANAKGHAQKSTRAKAGKQAKNKKHGKKQG
ncbi:MAG: hypothetical protein QM692_24245, partial [Thermomicrobiales bacterium]